MVFLSIYVTHVKCLPLKTKGETKISTLKKIMFSVILSRCVTAIMISLEIDHKFGLAIRTLPSLERLHTRQEFHWKCHLPLKSLRTDFLPTMILGQDVLF